MQMQMTNRWASNSATYDLPLIEVTGLYEDLESGIRANVLIECVQAGLDLPARFKLDLWRFDWLVEGSLRDMALSTAKSSVLVIFSASDFGLLPPPVENWISAWSQDPVEHASAMIALLPQRRKFRPGGDLLRERLQSAARQKGANFFCEYFDAPGAGSETRRRQARIPYENAAWSGQPAERLRLTVLDGQAANRIGRFRQRVHRP